MTIAKHLASALQAAAKSNLHTAAPMAAVLWLDKEAQWQAALPALQQLMPNLFVLGPYAPEQKTGPAIWLKCAIAGVLPDFPVSGVPVVYLPGISRADLRAIESCPRDLQPLAELQYRGGFWSQANSKDWTVGAFLSSKNGGLGLDVAQDRATQEALAHALRAGVLLDCAFADFQNRSINAEWLLNLLAPNPSRDLLQWMNTPRETQEQWGEVLWDVFIKRCRADFGFDPIADGVCVAAECLARGEGKWAAVSVLYRDSFSRFPHIYEQLANIQPPQMGLFPDQQQLAGYPIVNEQSEATLRYALAACASMDAIQARAAVLHAEKEHGQRRDWLWSNMGRSPLASSLAHLAQVAQCSATLPVGATPVELAHCYQQTGWQVDAAALQALACVNTPKDLDAVGAALRAMYLPWLEESALRLQEAAKSVGGLTPLPVSQSQPLGTLDGVCSIFVDGLRYDVAKQLEQRLTVLGRTHLSAAWSSMPSVTASGKAWCSPVAEFVEGSSDNVDFEPQVAADGKPLSAYNFRRLLVEHGIDSLQKHETGDPEKRAWTEVGDLDHYGHQHGIRLARELNTQIDQVVERVTELYQAGWRQFRIVTDHGWLLIPGGLPKSDLPKHQVETRWGRCAVLKDNTYGTPLTFGWDWCKSVQVAYAPGVTNFCAGVEYAHGGISLQECLVPVLRLDAEGVVASSSSPITIQSINWRGLRCTVLVEGALAGQQVDIRTKAALASTSLVASVKPINNGKASLAIADDEQLGTAAVIVVFNTNGDVLQKQATTVGEI